MLIQALAGILVKKAADWMGGNGRNAKAPELPADLRYVDDKAGFAVRVEFARLPRGGELHAAVHVMSESGEFLGGEGDYRDRDGDFLLVAPIDGDTCKFYLPLSGVRYKDAAKFVILCSVVARAREGVNVLGRATFFLPFPSPNVYGRIELLRPIIELCVHVVRANGVWSDVQAGFARDWFEREFKLAAGERSDLRRALRKDPRHSPSDNVETANRRLPNLDRAGFVSLLACLATSEGEACRQAVSIIRETAIGLGMRPSSWEQAARDLNLDAAPARSQEPQPVDYWAVLGVSRGAAPEEIKKAYLRKIAEYHPDRMGRMPVELQELAERMTKDLNRAYEALVRK